MELKEKVTAVMDDSKSVEKIDDLENDVDVEEFDDKDEVKTDDVVEDKVPKDKTPVEKTPEPEKWDKERQRGDQAEANFRKTKLERDTIEAKYTDAAKRVESLEAKLTELTKVEDVKLDDIDSYEPRVLAAIKSLQAQIKSATARADALEIAKKGFEKLENDRRLESRVNQDRQEIITDIESEFPAKFRNEAIKMANEICVKRGFSPDDRYEASKLLRSCYKDLSDTDKKPDKSKKVPTDSGKSAGAIEDNAPKEGSLREIAAEWKKKLRR